MATRTDGSTPDPTLGPSRRGFLRGAATGLGGMLLAPRWRATGARSADRRVLLFAGAATHGFGEHEHEAGCRMLARWLGSVEGLQAEVICGPWPPDDEAFDGVDAVVFYGDGGDRFPVTGHEAQIDELARRGVGLGFLHYALMPPADEAWSPRMQEWIGGHYEPGWSVNPFWSADVTAVPEHPVTRGVRPFSIEDEWYYNMRFRPEMQGVTPIVSAIPPDETRRRPHGPHSGNPHVEARIGEREHLAWVATRDDGGRGFGCTGGHWHWNWAHDDFRTLVLNAIAWLAHFEVPKRGVPSRTPTLAELLAPLPEPPEDFDVGPVERRIAGWRAAGRARRSG